MIPKLRLAISALFVLAVAKGFAQAPTLSYTSPQVYHINAAIAPLTPTSSNVAAPAYSTSGKIVASGFNSPYGVAVDAAGNIYVADTQNNDVKETPAGGGANLTLYSDNNPLGIATDAAGNVYVADFNAVEIPAGGGAARLLYSAGDPISVAVDPSGNVYVGTERAEIVKLPVGGGAAITLASASFPSGLAVDAIGNVYYCEADAGKLFKIPVGGVATELAYSIPNSWGVAVDASGNVFVSLASNNTVREYFHGGPSYISIATGLPDIEGIALDANNNLYVVDRTGVVKKIAPDGGYYINKELPAGLTFNSSTGTISGTPTAASPATNYVITGYNTTGGTSTTISIEVLSDNAQLAGLSLSTGTLSPAFSPTTTTYTADVDYATTAVTVTPVTVANTSTVTVNGVAVASGSASTAIPLAVGPNTITTVVTAGDGTTKQTYTTTVTREVQSNNANLSALSISSGTLTPVFNTNTTSYTASVSGSISSISLTPSATVAASTIKVNGVTVASGSQSAAIPLNAGSNTITTVVTAQDGVTTTTYTLTVTKAPSNIASLSNITVSKGTLSPAFASGTTSYTNLVTNGTTSVTLTPTATDPTATIKVNGTVVKSGHASGPVTLAVGSNAVTVVVTAQDGTTTSTYNVNVIRPSTNAKLSNLTISYGTLTPAFNTDSIKYSEFVPYSVSTMTIKPTATVSGSTITVNGVAVASGSAATPVMLNVGTTTINTVVTAQDGVTTKTYTLIVTRPAGSTNDNLSALTVSKGTLSPVFNTSTLTYSDMVTNGTTSLTVTPTLSNANATMTVNGTAVVSGHASGPITLAVGSNVVTILVTAQNGTNTKTYKITVIRPSTNAKLSAFTISSGTLTPAFNTNTTSYTASVTNATSSITVTPTVAVTGATVKVNGTAVTSGSASGAIALTVGSNTITTVITAQDGTTTDTYTLTVTRAASGENIPDATVSVDKPIETIILAEDDITVHQGISPNGDGINDFLQIDNISQYPENKLSITNRNGQLVFEAKGYDNATKIFDGHSNKTGQMQLPGTYFYSLDYKVNGIVKHKTGFLVLKY